MGIDIHRIMQGLIDNRFAPGGPTLWFADPAQFTFVAKNAIYSFQTVLGDGVVVSLTTELKAIRDNVDHANQIYRCYMVWHSVWIIIIPLIMLCGVASTLSYRLLCRAIY